MTPKMTEARAVDRLRALITQGGGPAPGFLVLIVALMGCSSAPVAVRPVATPQPATFDVTAVKSHFADQCTNPTFDVEYACENMEVDKMTGDAAVLNVPTELDPSAGGDGRADKVCQFVATVHYDNSGDSFGYESIAVLDRDGLEMVTCRAAYP